MIQRMKKLFKVYSAKRIVEYDEKQIVTKGEAIERKPLSSYLPKSIGKKLPTKNDVTSHQSEDQVVSDCTKWLKAHGWIPYTIFTGGIPIGGGRYGTNPAKGIPDSLIFNLSIRQAIWIEYKKSKGGILSPEQQDWHYRLITCGHTLFIVTSLQSLKEQLEAFYTDKMLKKSA